MFEEIKNIDPEKMDVSEMKHASRLMLNIIEGQASMIDNQAKEIKFLKDEIDKLKGGQGGYTPRYPNVTSDLDKAKGKGKGKGSRKKGKKGGGKKANLKVDQTIRCQMDKSKLPADAKLHRYDRLIQQDLIIKRHNTLFEIPVYYSKTTNKTYRGELPADYQGQFGGKLKAWIQLLHHYCDTTQGRLKALFKNLDIVISTGTINNILLSHTDKMDKETLDILSAGIKQAGYAQVDHTKTFEAGQSKGTQVICGPLFSGYRTMEGKLQAHVIAALQGRVGNDVPLLYDEQAVADLKASLVPKKDQRLINGLLELGQTYTLESYEAILKNANASHLIKKVISHNKVLAILALRYYKTQTDFPILKNMVTDAGPEYKGITDHRAMCWFHEERLYKKMIPKITIHQKAVDKVIGQIWIFYKKLAEFKECSLTEQKKRRKGLIKDFDKIFTQRTVYDELNKKIENTFSRKEKLLRVLYFPDIPLHNNLAELAIRRKVRKRDISLHTMSAQGTRAQDAFMSVVETAAKLGVNALDYLYDRITGEYKMPSLADLIRLRPTTF